MTRVKDYGNKILMKINFLTKANKKDLLRRIADVLTIELLEIKKSKTLTYKEMSTLTAIPQNRLSELIQKQKLNEKTLSGVIGGNIVRVADILRKVGPLTNQEKIYLENFYYHEDRELMELLLKCREAKVDPKKVLKAALKR